MSSFFTLPASAKKRKRNEDSTRHAAPQKKQARSSRPGERNGQSTKVKRAPRDESISGSESGDSERGGGGFFSEGEDEAGSSVSSNEGETGAERRLRLAEQYLENVRNEVEQIGFDAEDLDRDLIAERLKEDVAETKGRMYRFMADNYDYSHASRAHFRMGMGTDCVTAIAVCSPYAYTVSKSIQLVKWELPPPSTRRRGQKSAGPPQRQRPKKLLSTRGHGKGTKAKDSKSPQHHTAPILCVAASPDGRFVATGGRDKKLIMWNATDLTPLRTFSQHRDAVTSLAIQPGLNRLYSASYDRTIKTWGLNEQAYVETLFGHQDHVVDVAALSNERCLSVGARDRTVRLWKVVEESQLVFRGGGSGSGGGAGGGGAKKYGGHHEGSIERVVAIDDETFITGSDNGALSLWSTQKKKPVFVLPCAHGLDPALKPAEVFAEEDLKERQVPASPQPRWITALAAIPLSDLVISGSWDGVVRVWKVTKDKKRLEAVGGIGIGVGGEGDTANDASTALVAQRATGPEMETEIDGDDDGDGMSEDIIARGIVNDLAVFERGTRGADDGIGVVAALGKEHRLGRWRRMRGGKNGAVVFEIPSSLIVGGEEEEEEEKEEK